jgi:hypothetical protein
MMSKSLLQAKEELNNYRYPYPLCWYFCLVEPGQARTSFFGSDLVDVFTSSLAMARTVRDSGRVSVKDMAKVRVIAEAF